ncbi:MAG: hypothetical protein JNM58_15230 [Xanthomonadaceae bacterium]|nr:hypothetical protein [Xanthomonadaceae bacterium]
MRHLSRKAGFRRRSGLCHPFPACKVRSAGEADLRPNARGHTRSTSPSGGLSMKRSLLAGAVLASVVPMLSIPAVAYAAGGKQTRTLRGELVHRIVMKWGNHVQEAHRADVRHWAMGMVPTFNRVSIDTLSKASQAKTFDAMNNVLLGDAVAPDFPNLAVAVGKGALPLPEKALGDAATDLVYVPVTPCRVIDTRVAGGVISANSTRNFDITDVADFAFQGEPAAIAVLAQQAHSPLL